MINEILLRRKNHIYIEDICMEDVQVQEKCGEKNGQSVERQRLRALTMMRNTEKLGYVFSQELFVQFVRLEETGRLEMSAQGPEEACRKKMPVQVAEQSAQPRWWDARLQKMQLQKDILDTFESVADQVPTPVLLQVRTHFQYRNHQSFRYYFPKGRFAEARIIENADGQVEDEVCAQVVNICERALVRRFAQLAPMGKVWISEELRDYLVPFAHQ